GTANVEYTFRVSDTSIDWGTTFRVNGSEIGVMLQNVGDGMAVAGYGLTLSVVGAEIGVPLAGIGSGISFGGSIMESVATANFGQGTASVGSQAISIGTKYALKRTGLSILSQQILRQNVDLKVTLINRITN
uniref:hypothetical protein n=2 Tax=Arenibacter TaxID=178469 RepID=UPI0015940EB3